VLDGLNKASSDTIERIIPALHWFRKALTETIPADQFRNLWTALETLNPLVKVKHGLPIEKPVRACPNCGASVVMEPTSAGIKYALTDLIGESGQAWAKANKTRKGLDHAIGHMTAVQDDAIACLPLLRRAVLTAVFNLLDLPHDQHAALIRAPLGFLRDAYMISRVTILDFPQDRVMNRTTRPYFRFTLSEPPITGMTEGGLRKQSTKSKIDLIGAEGFKYSGLKTTTIFEKDPENEQAKLDVQFE
jgi:hypothetical protein